MRVLPEQYGTHWQYVGRLKNGRLVIGPLTPLHDAAGDFMAAVLEILGKHADGAIGRDAHLAALPTRWQQLFPHFGAQRREACDKSDKSDGTARV